MNTDHMAKETLFRCDQCLSVFICGEKPQKISVNQRSSAAKKFGCGSPGCVLSG